MKNLLVYYGWLNSFNSAQNSWNNEKVAQDLAKYDVLIFGDGLQTTTHGDYANTLTILARIKVLNPDALIFGYVTVNQTYANFKTKADDWNDLSIHGIFFDEAGYDYGSVSTNGRAAINDKIDYVHSLSYSNVCFVNAWKVEHIWGENSDASYPDTTWNPDDLNTNLCCSDWYMYESLAIDSNENFESHTQWASRVDPNLPLNTVAVSVIADGKSDGLDRFKFIWVSAAMNDLDAVGSSDTNYGATSAKTQMWARPDEYIEDTNPPIADGSKYLSYGEGGRYILDFTSGSEAATIEIY